MNSISNDSSLGMEIRVRRQFGRNRDEQDQTIKLKNVSLSKVRLAGT